MVGMFNYLSFEHKCPRCGAEMLMETEIKLGKLNLDTYRIGNHIDWGKAASRPANGTTNGDGYVECGQCHKDFWIQVKVENDIIVGVEDKGNGYIL